MEEKRVSKNKVIQQLLLLLFFFSRPNAHARIILIMIHNITAANVLANDEIISLILDL